MRQQHVGEHEARAGAGGSQPTSAASASASIASAIAAARVAHQITSASRSAPARSGAPGRAAMAPGALVGRFSRRPDRAVARV
jgi:hypothetical protein